MYKLYQSKKKIPWITTDMVNVPNKDITDNWFNFELVQDTGIYFETWDSGKIVVKSNDITYFKIENDVDNTKRYFYVESVSKVLKTGFELNVRMDIYMTYTKHLLNSLTTHRPIIERVYFNRKMFKTNPELRKSIYYAFRREDELFEGADYAPKKITLLTYNLLETQFPWNLDFADGSHQFTLGNQSQSQSGGVMNIQPDDINDADKKKFTQNYGLYVVMMHGETGNYHLYPINKKQLELNMEFQNTSLNNEFSKQLIINDYNYLMKHIAGRYEARTNDPVGSPNLRKNFGFGLNGIYDIEHIYQSNSFQGIYRAPQLFRNKSKQNYLGYGWWGWNGTKLVFHYYTELNPQKPVPIEFPKTLTVENTIIDTYIELSQPIKWGKSEMIPRRYLSFYERDNLTNTESDGNIFTPLFYLSFMGEFIATPTPNEYMDENDMVGFGGQFPSASNEFTENMRKIKQTYDTGLSNAAWGVAQGIPSGIGKLAAAPLWTVTSLVGSAITLAKDVSMLKLNRKYQTINTTASYINSTTSDWFYFNEITRLINASGIVDSHWEPERPNMQNLYETAIEKTFSDNQKEQIRYILSKYGFKYNMSLKWNDWYNNLENNETAYIKFNDEWIDTMLPQIITDKWNLEVQKAVATQLSNGIRINMEWV